MSFATECGLTCDPTTTPRSDRRQPRQPKPADPQRLHAAQETLVQTSTISIPDIRASITGQVIGPDDPEYDKARTVVAGGIDRRPAVIVRVADVEDVATVIALARRDRPRAGGPQRRPQRRGHCVTEGGIVLDLSDMKATRHRRPRPHGVGRDRPDRGRVFDRRRGARARHRLRRHGFRRDRRDHARRRRRLPRPQVRADDRRPPRRRDRHGRWRAAPRRRRRTTPTCSGRSAAAAATSAS